MGSGVSRIIHPVSSGGLRLGVTNGGPELGKLLGGLEVCRALRDLEQPRGLGPEPCSPIYTSRTMLGSPW